MAGTCYPGLLEAMRCSIAKRCCCTPASVAGADREIVNLARPHHRAWVARFDPFLSTIDMCGIVVGGPPLFVR